MSLKGICYLLPKDVEVWMGRCEMGGNNEICKKFPMKSEENS